MTSVCSRDAETDGDVATATVGGEAKSGILVNLLVDPYLSCITVIDVYVRPSFLPSFHLSLEPAELLYAESAWMRPFASHVVRSVVFQQCVE